MALSTVRGIMHEHDQRDVRHRFSRYRKGRPPAVTNPWRELWKLPPECRVLFLAILVNRAGSMALAFLALYLTTRQSAINMLTADLVGISKSIKCVPATSAALRSVSRLAIELI